MIVCGEALIDLVPHQNAYLAKPGGGPFNVAVTAARQGAQVRFVSRISTDGFGQQLATKLSAENVNISLTNRGPEPTSLAVTTITDDGSATYSFYFEGTADRLANPQNISANIAYFGTASLALEPAASAYFALGKNLAQTGAFIALDPNIRSFYATAAHKKRLLEFLPCVSLLKLSEAENEFLDNPSAPVKIITKGKAGLTLIIDGITTHISAPKITVADTIGAGDTIMGTLLANLQKTPNPHRLEPAKWQTIARKAAVAAALTCTRNGAEPPTLTELETFLAKL